MERVEIDREEEGESGCSPNRTFEYGSCDEDFCPATLGPTLLPGPMARFVSWTTRSSSFAVRMGTLIGDYSIGATRVTTLSSLELGRSILEGILSRAGRDVMTRTRSEYGADSAENILERSLENLHHTMNQLVFWTSAGFHVVGATVSTASYGTQILLSCLDQFFGSTDSSRAIASIITLIQREFQNPATGAPGEKVGFLDIVMGLCGLAYLQTTCRKTLQEEIRRLGQEDVIWDVVVLDDGERVDVQGDILSPGRKSGIGNGNISNDRNGILEAIERHGAHDSDSEDELPEIQLRNQIMTSLPDDASVTISTATNTTKTITVEIKGAPKVPNYSFPGADIIESEMTYMDGESPGLMDDKPTYRVVYRISRNKLRSTAVEKDDDDDTQSRIEVVDDSSDDTDDAEPPPVPLKFPPASEIFNTSSRPRSPLQSPSAATSPRSSTSNLFRDRDRSSSSQLPLSRQTAEHIANQKRIRQPLGNPSLKRADESKLPTKAKSQDIALVKVAEKKGGLRSALKRGSIAHLPSFLNRDQNGDSATGTNKTKSISRPPWGSHKPAQTKTISGPSRPSNSNVMPARDAPRPPQRGNPNYFSSRDLADMDDDVDECVGSSRNTGPRRSQSRSSYVAVHHHRRSSTISQTDTYSIQSFESRPASPPPLYRMNNSISKSKSGNDMSDLASPCPRRSHYKGSQMLGVGSVGAPSIYTLKAGGSHTSLILSSCHQRSAYNDSEAVDTLRRTGRVDGMFPNFHILRNITRYSRYASAAYGSNFLKLMRISKELPILKVMEDTHQEVRSFAHHTQLPTDSVLLSSFVDPEGGSDATGCTHTGIPLVHTIALDAESKAVVLSCRGTLDFEDVLTDMMCSYDDLVWRDRKYKVHKGIHASARRLLYGGDGRVLVTLKEALEEFPDYGLVLCGHSLGGGVTALLGTMLAEPAMTGTAFVTSARQHHRFLTDGRTTAVDMSHICLPSGRPIHVYAYGPPATMSPSLQKATRGLITSVINGRDLVPHLSLGVLHDFQALALAFKTDNGAAKAEVRQRVWEGLQSSFHAKWQNTANYEADQEEKGQWAFAFLKTLRASMMSDKLIPPGEVFSVESSAALRREAYCENVEEHIGRPATRIILKYVRDVEARFRELRFGATMLLDHNPGRYEESLRKLTSGVVGI